jgi:hypothetical protein
MAFAQGSRSQLAVGVQSDFTTTATSFTNLPFSTHSLNLAKERLAGTDIQSHRMPTVDRHGARSVGGDIVADLRHDEFDVLMEAALMSDSSFDTGFTAGDGTTTVTNAAILGTTPKFLSIEDYAADVDQARLFTGCTVNTMAVSLAPNQMVTSTFGIVGRDMSISQTQKTVTASADNQPFDSYSGSIKLGDKGSLGSELTIITAVDFTLTNGFAPTMVVGETSASDLEFGTASLEGTITAYFEDATMINRFLGETESALEVVVGDPETVARTLTFTFPRIKINSADVGVDGPTSRLVNMSFVALRDDTDLSSSTTDTNTLIKITKSTA